MKREHVMAGLAGGIIFGTIQSVSIGPLGGLLMGCFFAGGIAWGLHRFSGSVRIRHQVEFPEAVLLPGERVLLSRPANLVVDPKRFGLERFVFGGLMWVFGMKDKESLGGAIHVTNYRMLFRTHRFNRLRGMTSVFLPTIQKAENRSFLIVRKLTVTTVTANVNLVVADPDEVASAIYDAKSRINDFTLTALKAHVSTFPKRCCDDLEVWKPIDRLNRVLHIGRRTGDAIVAVSCPFTAFGKVFINELFDLTVVDAWESFVQGEPGGDRHAA